MVLNQYKVFLAIATGHINAEIFLRQRKQYNLHQGIFGKVFTSNGFSGATTLTQITLKFTILDKAKKPSFAAASLKEEKFL
jgi:hypothetical protein